jgi:hypothetical protein
MVRSPPFVDIQTDPLPAPTVDAHDAPGLPSGSRKTPFLRDSAREAWRPHGPFAFQYLTRMPSAQNLIGSCSFDSNTNSVD